MLIGFILIILEIKFTAPNILYFRNNVSGYFIMDGHFTRCWGSLAIISSSWRSTESKMTILYTQEQKDGDFFKKKYLILLCFMINEALFRLPKSITHTPSWKFLSSIIFRILHCQLFFVFSCLSSVDILGLFQYSVFVHDNIFQLLSKLYFIILLMPVRSIIISIITFYILKILKS